MPFENLVNSTVDNCMHVLLSFTSAQLLEQTGLVCLCCLSSIHDGNLLSNMDIRFHCSNRTLTLHLVRDIISILACMAVRDLQQTFSSVTTVKMKPSLIRQQVLSS